MVPRKLLVILILQCAVLSVSCSGGGNAAPTTSLPTLAPMPTQAVVPTTAPAQVATQALAATATTAPAQPKPTLLPASPTQAAKATSSSPSSSTKLDMDKIFPPGPGRDLVLNNCVNCHSIVPIVTLQKDPQQWDEWARNHRERVPGISDQEFATLKAYLVANFNPQNPVPDLPADLLSSWTSY